MSFPIPSFTRGQISRAGVSLIEAEESSERMAAALELINHWRACHAYPVNTFQATLRARLQKVSPNAFVATRLKRVPSIHKKLQNNAGMQLARMQDIGGLRAVVENVNQVRRLQNLYTNGSLSHQLIDTDDYIDKPKSTGYRSLHLIYKYQNHLAPAYDGLCLELQIRTRLQHAWATAVETIGSFLNQALKSNEGPDDWLNYFKVVGNAFALIEKCPVAEEFADWAPELVFQECCEMEALLDVRRKLSAFSLAANAITSSNKLGSYHLIVLDAVERTVTINSFGVKRLDEANAAYAEAEKVALGHPDMQTVLVTSTSVKNLRRAYPNYFLDTKQFLLALTKIEKLRMKSADLFGSD
jgi:ppGpp synthetase/RelA/SpoT-type nucleotidyltranferase